LEGGIRSMRMIKTLVVMLAAVAVDAGAARAQDLSAWERFDFAHKRVDEVEVTKLSLSELRLLRGIVFGRHGRSFADEPDVQAYLKTKSWFRPDPKFSNTRLSAMEKANIDV